MGVIKSSFVKRVEKMIFKKSYRKPFYKDLLISRKNVLNSTKIFYLKKKKWEKFIFFSKRKFKFFKRFRFYDQLKLNINKFSSSGNAFKKYFKNFLIKLKQLKILYGGFKKKKIKSLFLKVRRSSQNNCNTSLKILTKLEHRLDTILNRAKFCSTPKEAKQLISHGHVLVNGKKIISYHCFLKKGDIVEISKNKNSIKLVRQNLMKNVFWPLPPSYLKINYKTLTIINLNNFFKNTNFFLPSNLDINFLNNQMRFR